MFVCLISSCVNLVKIKESKALVLDGVKLLIIPTF